MAIKIKNRDVLLSHGDVESKRIVLDVAEKTKGEDLQLFLIEYVELQLEMDNLFEYTERLQTMYLDNNKQGIADVLNAYVKRLDEHSVSHQLPLYTTENLPDDLFEEESSTDALAETDATDPETQNQIGEDYYYGRNGKEQIYAKATRWYRKAAGNGHMYAQYNLGWCYEKGLGVAALPVEAAKWYRKAAEQGHAPSQCNLGLCYETGEGAVKDLSMAVSWYRKSAEQNYLAAQCNLGFCYKNGIGVKQDEAEAFVRMPEGQIISIALSALDRLKQYDHRTACLVNPPENSASYDLESLMMLAETKKPVAPKEDPDELASALCDVVQSVCAAERHGLYTMEEVCEYAAQLLNEKEGLAHHQTPQRGKRRL